MAKVNLDLESTVRAIAKNEAKKQVEQMANVDDAGFIQDVNIAGVVTDATRDTAMKKMVSSFSSEQGFYGKIYRKKFDGKFDLLDYTIESPESFGDLETEVKDVVKSKGWGAGNYQVKIFDRNDRRGFKFASAFVNIPPQTAEERKEQRPGNGGNGQPQVVDMTDKVIEGSKTMIEFARTITPPQVPPTDMGAIGKTITDAINIGINMVKSNAPTEQTIPVIQIITALKDILKPADVSPELTLLKQEIEHLKEELRKKDEKKPDALDELVRIRQAGLIKFQGDEKKEDALESVNRITSIISAVAPLVNPSSAPASTLDTILKLAEPLLTSVATPAKEWFESKKLETQYRLEALRRGQFIPMNPGQNVAQNPPQIQSGAQGTQSNQMMLNPMIKKILDAVVKKDKNQFDYLRQTIYTNLGPHYIEGMVNGDITADFIISGFATQYEPQLRTMRLYELVTGIDAKEYLGSFILWLRSFYAQKSTQQESTSLTSLINPMTTTSLPVVVGRCDKCGEEFEFDTEADLLRDNQCECNGKISLIDSSGPG